MRTSVEGQVKESVRRGCVSDILLMQDSVILQPRLAGLTCNSSKWKREVECVARLPLSTETYEIKSAIA